jgi:alpha-L-fucosidase
MYIEGSRQYNYHVKTYGHPSKIGFKDVIHSWKAERFDAKNLLKLYKEAGAKYFLSMGVHCDNFDLWNSKHHRWNAVNMGPKKDIVGLFRQATQEQGLKFGVSEHVWGSYNWFATNKGADKEGPYKGVPYDGNDPANRDLYHEPHPIPPQAWAEQGNEPLHWKKEWFTRIKDLIDQYQPDLLYTDGAIPFGEWGRGLAAHYYNRSLEWHKGKVEVVYSSKRRSDCEVGTCVLDIERGVVDDIWPQPWQTDTCVGHWHYDKEAKYKSPKLVIDLLVDIVSRNGNLLLNIPLRSDGTPDDAELKIVSALSDWMRVNSEAIYATRPWKICGEGPSVQKTPQTGGFEGTAEHFNERNRKDLTAGDVRYVTKGKALYAFAMGWPSQEFVFGALAPKRNLYAGKVKHVEMLGYRGKLTWKQGDEGLRVQVPADKPCEHAVVIRVS